MGKRKGMGIKQSRTKSTLVFVDGEGFFFHPPVSGNGNVQEQSNANQSKQRHNETAPLLPVATPPAQTLQRRSLQNQLTLPTAWFDMITSVVRNDRSIRLEGYQMLVSYLGFDGFAPSSKYCRYRPCSRHAGGLEVDGGKMQIVNAARTGALLSEE
ncbi:unnamed protein product [Fusarium venenatum]|uniref:Uncharacterized protein n=1 Tax=Fusarium venenatum TaxID=56646 RepID=A0A2L2T193_9HYPO|nr:uncharacterized protein FVRRES_00844 [Fusarium venenatum]CEI64332.1 unnamed protein product [Fusarium venenatum]